LARIIPDRQIARLLNRVAWSRVKATKALGLEMPAILLGHADDVIGVMTGSEDVRSSGGKPEVLAHCQDDAIDLLRNWIRRDKYVAGGNAHMPGEAGKALLFDIDGTLADTDALHLQAFNKVFGPRGHVFDHARFTKELQGFPIPRSVSGFWRMNRLSVNRHHRREGRAFRKLVSGQIQRCRA